jgi:hypothetical protein
MLLYNAAALDSRMPRSLRTALAFGAALALILVLLFGHRLRAWWMTDATAHTAGTSATQEKARIGGLPAGVEVLDATCTPQDGRRRAEISLRNTGDAPMLYAKVWVRFDDADGVTLTMQDSFVLPHRLEPGAVGAVTVYSPPGAVRCTVESVSAGAAAQTP